MSKEEKVFIPNDDIRPSDRIARCIARIENCHLAIAKEGAKVTPRTPRIASFRAEIKRRETMLGLLGVEV